MRSDIKQLLIYNQLSYKMNIEKIVANYFQKKRSQSANDRKYHSTIVSADNNCNILGKSKCHQAQQYPFQPQVNQIPRSLYRVTSKTQCSREQIIERLYNGRKTMEGKWTVKKLAEEQKQYKQNCTFHPQTNPNSKRILKTQCTQQDPFQRLYVDGVNKKKLSQSLSYYQQNKQNFSFQPQTNYRNILNSQTCNIKPIHQRIQDIVKQKKQNIKRLVMSMEQKQLLEKPVINQISQKIVSNKEQFKRGILNRISIYIEEKKKKSEFQAAQQQKILLKECTFKPQINSTVQVSTSFLTRQEQYIRRIEQKGNSRFRQNSFQPQINKISQILMRQQRQGQTLEDKVNRLTYDTTKRQKIQQIQKQIYQQCTFVPQINVISKCLAAQHVSHKCNHTPSQQVYQFRPKINKISEQLSKKVRLKKCESVDHRQFQKQYLNQLKMQKEYKQLSQCTFKPKINYSKPKFNANLNEVKGYESFVKKIEKINQLKDQQKQIRQRLFNKQKNYRNRKSTTPVEFRLSQGYNTKEAVRQEVREKFQKQCTFKPQIISLR